MAWRLPNPPTIFVGRQPQQQRLLAMLRHGSSVVVWGPGGIGKTSLVAHTLHQHLPQWVERTVLLALRAGDTLESLLLVAAKALASLAGLPPQGDWHGALEDPAGLASLVVDLAEEGPWWLVIDDLQHLADKEAARFLECVGRYARRSRWIATSRRALRAPALLEQSLALGALSDQELFELAEQCYPDSDSAAFAQAVSRAQGSPWGLRCFLAGQTHDPDDLHRHLGPAVVEFLDTLACMMLPLSLEVLALLGAVPSPETLDELQAQGLVEETGAGIRLHDVSRGLWRPSEGERLGRLRRQLARALGESNNAAAALESVRLHLVEQQGAAAARVLELAYEIIIDAGLGPRLWEVLTRDVGDQTRPWRWRCALELGGGDALAWAVAQPRPGDPQQAFAWSELQYIAGRLPAAQTSCEELLLGPQAAGVHTDAAILAARCYLAQGHPSTALEILATAQRQGFDAAARVAALTALIQAVAGDVEKALGLAQGLLEQTRLLSTSARRAVEHDLLSLFNNTGRGRMAANLLESSAAGEQRSMAALASRRHMLRRSLCHIEAGRLQEGQRLLARAHRTYDAIKATGEEMGEVASEAAGAELSHFFARMNRVRLDMCRGDLNTVEDDILAMLRAAHQSGNADAYGWARVAWAVYVVLMGTPQREPLGLPSMTAIVGPQASYVRAYDCIRALRAGESLLSTTVPDIAKVANIIDVLIVTHLARAEAFLVGGRGGQAEQEALAALRLAREHGWHLYEIDAQMALWELHLIGENHPGVTAAAHALRLLVQPMQSPRFDTELHLIAHVSQAKRLSPQVFERLMAARRQSPVAGRRATAVLGEDATLDTRDRAVVQAILSRFGATVQTVRLVPAHRSVGVLGVDSTTAQVWRDHGEPLHFTEHPLLIRILETLLRHGGRASKEQLVLQAWDRPVYHPAKDDKRLQVGIRRLRERLESDAMHPSLLLTTEDGYAFAPGITLRWMRPCAPETLA